LNGGTSLHASRPTNDLKNGASTNLAGLGGDSRLLVRNASQQQTSQQQDGKEE
jgi:hypothetical protein